MKFLSRFSLMFILCSGFLAIFMTSFSISIHVILISVYINKNFFIVFHSEFSNLNMFSTGIDTDKYKYPIGSGRVTFNNTRSYMRAVAAAFIEIKSQKFSKKVQIDPYLEDSLCSVCGVQHGPYYCRDLSCFR